MRMGNRPVGRDVLLENLRRLAEKLGRTPTVPDIRQDGAWSHAVYQKYFGSISAAQRAAGFLPNTRGARRGALNWQVRRARRYHVGRGLRLTQREICELYGLKRTTVQARAKLGCCGTMLVRAVA